jgi:hypothetical protein
MFFGVRIGDFHYGRRATSIEFASKMVIKAALKGMRIAEISTVLHRDDRSRPPHLPSS